MGRIGTLFLGRLFSQDCGLPVIREEKKLQWENTSVQKDLNSSHLKQKWGRVCCVCVGGVVLGS